MLYYIYTHISFSYNIMLNTNHDQEFCPSWPWALTAEAERQSCAVTLKSDNEPGRCWSFCPRQRVRSGEALCSKNGAWQRRFSSSSLKFNIFQHFHKFPWFQSFGIHGIEEFACFHPSFWQPIAPYQMCNRLVIMVTSLPFQSNFRRPWQPWQPWQTWPGFVVRWDPIKWQF